MSKSYEKLKEEEGVHFRLLLGDENISITKTIFSFLNLNEILTIRECDKRFLRVVSEDFVWEKFFVDKFGKRDEIKFNFSFHYILKRRSYYEFKNQQQKERNRKVVSEKTKNFFEEKSKGLKEILQSYVFHSDDYWSNELRVAEGRTSRIVIENVSKFSVIFFSVLSFFFFVCFSFTKYILVFPLVWLSLIGMICVVIFNQLFNIKYSILKENKVKHIVKMIVNVTTFGLLLLISIFVCVKYNIDYLIQDSDKIFPWGSVFLLIFLYWLLFVIYVLLRWNFVNLIDPFGFIKGSWILQFLFHTFIIYVLLSVSVFLILLWICLEFFEYGYGFYVFIPLYFPEFLILIFLFYSSIHFYFKNNKFCKKVKRNLIFSVLLSLFIVNLISFQVLISFKFGFSYIFIGISILVLSLINVNLHTKKYKGNF